MSRALSDELMLAAACCRWPPSPEGDRTVRARAERVSDWHTFDKVVKRNRVSPLVHRAVRRAGIELPEPLGRQLAERAFAASRRSLLLARESLRLQQALEAAGIAVMVFKGIPTAVLAYGELGLKESIDIDLIVSPDQAVRARKLLIDEGYEINLDDFTEEQFERFIPHAYESGFVNKRNGLKIDLHWGLLGSQRLLRDLGVDGPAQSIAIPGGTLRTFADEVLFAYLSVHGSLHNWSRLKWAADLGAFLGRYREDELSRLYTAASTYDVGRCTSVALLLCHRLFDLRIDPQLRNSLESDRGVQALLEHALLSLDYGKGAAEHDAYSEPWFRQRAAQFRLAPGVAHWADQLRMLWVCPKDRARIPLPRRLSFLYHVIRMPLWLGRIGMRLAGRPVP